MPAYAFEDVDDFLDEEEFATTALLIFDDYNKAELRGIFDDPMVDQSLGQGRSNQYVTLETTQLRFYCPNVGVVQQAAKGHTLRVLGVDYVIVYKEVDGSGWVSLMLDSQRPASSLAQVEY